MKHAYQPLEDYEEHNQAWLKLPRPVKGLFQKFDIREECLRFLAEVQFYAEGEAKEQRLAQIRAGLEDVIALSSQGSGGPSSGAKR